MSEDFIEETFSDIFYPGSKRKRKERKPEEKADTDSWEVYSKTRTLPNGKDIEMFTIGALSVALGRPIITLRLWMDEGHIPLSPYRLPSKLDKNGKMREGRRLYTRPMIEAAVNIFAKAGVLHAKRIVWAEHRNITKQLTETWEEIRQHEQQ
jgi:hypothetical protein